MAQFRAPPKGQRRLRSFKMITPQDPPSPILEIPETSSPSSPRRRSTSTKERCDTGCSDNARKSDLTQHSSSPTNKSRGESNNYVRTPTPSIARAESPKLTLYKFTIKNIPENFASQKKFHTLLTTHLLIKNIYRLVVNWNKTALLITSLPLPDNFLHNLNIAAGSKAITCTPINKKTAPNEPNIDNPRKKPQFSIVIKHVDHDIDENDINHVLASLELPIQRLWRIKSRQSNKFTIYHGRHRDSRFPTEKRTKAVRQAPSVRAIEAPGTHPPAMHQVLSTRPPRDRLHKQTRVPQMPRNARPQQLRGRDPEVSPLRRRSRRLVTQVPQIERHPHHRRDPNSPHVHHQPPRRVCRPRSPRRRIRGI
jgi:hypothetical protein